MISDSEGRTPLHWAVDRGHFNVVELLISKGTDVNAKVQYKFPVGLWFEVFIYCYFSHLIFSCA